LAFEVNPFVYGKFDRFTIISIFSHKLGNVALRLDTILVVHIEAMIITREVNIQGPAACQKACFTMAIHAVRKWPTIFIFNKKQAPFFVLANRIFAALFIGFIRAFCDSVTLVNTPDI